jgi:hypothetical protein
VIGDGLKQALKKLALEDVLALGLGEKRVRVRARVLGIPSENSANGQEVVSRTLEPEDDVKQSIEVAGTNEDSTGAAAQAGEDVMKSIEVAGTEGYPIVVAAQPIQTPPKKRGRPRKSDGALQPPSSSAVPQTPRVRIPRKLFDPAEKTLLKPQKTSREDIRPVQIRTGQIREAVFTSHREMQHEAGVAGVYLDPPGSEKPQETNSGRGKKCVIAVFKSDKLKDPQWLEKSKGSWIEVAAERIAAAVIERDEDDKDAVLIPTRKRKRPRPNRDEERASPPKKGLPRNNPVPLDETPPETTLPSTRNAAPNPAVPFQPGYQSPYTTSKSSNHQPLDEMLFSSPSVIQRSSTPKSAPKVSTPRPQNPQQVAQTLSAQSNHSKQFPVQQATVQDSPVQQPSNQQVAVATQRNYQSPYSPSLFRPQNPDVDPYNYKLTEDPNGPRTHSHPTAGTSATVQPLNTQHSNSQLATPQPQNTHISSHLMAANPPSPAIAYQSPYQSQSPMTHQERQATLSVNSQAMDAKNQGEITLFAPKKTPITLLQRQETEARLQSYKSPFRPATNVTPANPVHSSNFASTNSTQFSPAHPTTILLQSSSLTSSLQSSFRQPFLPPANESPQTQASTVYSHQSPLAVLNNASAQTPAAPVVPYNSPYAPGKQASSPKSLQTPHDPPRGQFSAQFTPQDSTQHQVFFTPKPPAPQITSTENRKRKRKRSGVDGHIAMPQELDAATKDRELEDVLAVAEAAPILNGTGRISAVYREIVGNLILSNDKSTLEFRGVKNTLELVLRVSSITQNPITSIPGSNPMELRIKAKDSSDVEAVHCFMIARTNTAYQAANTMRTKLVTAIITMQFRAGETYDISEQVSEQQLEIMKPFKCDKCSSRFKNKEGIIYHQSKSNTTCNPNFDPVQYADRKSKVAKEKTPAKERTPMMEKTADKDKILRKAKTPKVPKPPAQEPSAIQKKDASDKAEEPIDYESTSESEDSIFEWAEQHAVPGYDSKPLVAWTPEKANPTSRRYKSLPAETSVLREVLKEVASVPAAAHGHLDAPATIANGIETTKETPKAVDELRLRWSKHIILELVDANGGLFPGDQGLWIAFVAVWLKRHPQSGVLPESKLCSMTLDSLIEAGELHSTKLACRGKGKRDVTRTIVSKPNAVISPLIIEKLKELIKESYPAYYIPASFAPPEIVLAKLQAIAMRAINNVVEDEPKLSRARRGSNLLGDGRRESTSTNNDDFVSGDEEDEAESDKYLEDGDVSDGDDFYDEPRFTPEVPKENETTSEVLARKLRDRWGRVKAAGKNTLSLTGTQINWGPQGSGRRRSGSRVRIPITNEDKEKRAAKAAHQLQAWQTPPSFLPNSETGAWDQTPTRVKKVHRLPARRYNLPEPITFMQTPDGAWSIRAFGHGVKPIYARPARRADGNPNAGWYLNRIEGGFRPVVYPTKNRLFLPAVPSKVMLRHLDPDNPTPPRKSRSKYQRRESSSASPEDLQSVFEIPKGTGLPKRKYAKRDGPPTRRASTISQFESDDLEQVNFPESVTKRQTRMSARTGEPLDELHILNFFEPKRLVPGDERNAGLDSLPKSFGLNAQDNHSLDGALLPVMELQFAISRPVQNDSDLIDGFSWALDDWTPYKSEDFELRWSEETAFDVETLPYEELMTDSQEFGDEMARQPVKRQRREKDRQEFLPSRPQTALPSDLQGLMDEARDAATVLSVELAQPSDISRKRKRFVNGDMTLDVENRFVVAVIVIRTLTGGLELLVDWVIVGSLFPDFSINYLRKFWQSSQQKKERAIEQLVNNFREAFLPAYEDGLIEPIDYDHLVDYNWDKLIDWTMNKVSISLGPKAVLLPDSKKQLGKKYLITELDPKANNWRETYFSLNAPVYKRIELAASVPKVLPIKPKFAPTCAEDVEIDNLTLAKSWVRASALTPEDDWDKEVVKSLLNHLGEELVNKALEALIEEKIIMHRSKGRATPNRSYEATDVFTSTLRRHINEKQFVEAVRYKRFLDVEFKSGKACVRSDYMANEGTLMAVTSLQAKGRITLKGVGVPSNKFGLTDGAYETRKIPPERFRFEMDIYPTNSYIFDADNDILHKLAHSESPCGGKRGELPVWRGVTDKVIPDLWKRVIVAVAGITALRAGITADGLKRAFAPTLEEWEIMRLMEWGVDIGVFEHLHESIEGWTVGEWWWLLVGRICVC